jgi:hypothetical protein
MINARCGGWEVRHTNLNNIIMFYFIILFKIIHY